MARGIQRYMIEITPKSFFGRFLRPVGPRNFNRSYSAVVKKKMGKQFEASSRCFSNSEPNIVKPCYPELKMPNMPLHELIFENLGQWENKVALECGETGRKYTYRELMKCSKLLASSLQRKFGMKKGDSLAIILPNCPEYPVIFLAGSMRGVPSTTINPVYTPTEISMQLDIVKPKILFTTPEVFVKCVEALNLIKLEVPVVVVKNRPNAEIPQGGISYDELTQSSTSMESLSFENPQLDDDLVLPFSSGTSGVPKGVQLTHRNIVANLEQYAMVNELKSNPEAETNQTVVLGLLPMFHIYGMVVVTFDALRFGCRLVTLPRFEPKLFVDTIFSKKVQILYLVPPLMFFLGNQPMVEARHLEHVQHVVIGAAPCGKTDSERLMKKAKKLAVSQGYGMSETSPVITITHKDRFHKLSSVGHPLPSTFVKVVDVKSGKTLPLGSRGEICVKGPQVMRGYWHRPEETKKAFDDKGWLKTGDIGYYDEEGDFFIVDRIKDLIKVKGFQVAPAELEEFLRNHPKVLDSAVIGVKHPELGEVPKAFVVLKENVTATEEEIQEFIKGRLSSYKQLKGGVEFVKEIPKSNAGKILRRHLKNEDETKS